MSIRNAIRRIRTRARELTTFETECGTITVKATPEFEGITPVDVDGEVNYTATIDHDVEIYARVGGKLRQLCAGNIGESDLRAEITVQRRF